MRHKGLFALLERDGVDYRLALTALQSLYDDFPLGRVDHDGHLGHIGIRGHHVEEIAHLLTGIEQPVVHVHIDHHCPVGHLLTGNGERLFVVFLLDKTEKLARAGHVAPLAHIDKHARTDCQRLQAAQLHVRRTVMGTVGHLALRQFGIAADKTVVGSTTSTHDIDQPAIYELLYLGCHRLGRLIILPHRVGQSGIGIGRYIIR